MPYCCFGLILLLRSGGTQHISIDVYMFPICAYVYIYIYIYMHTYTYIYTHAAIRVLYRDKFRPPSSSPPWPSKCLHLMIS